MRSARARQVQTQLLNWVLSTLTAMQTSNLAPGQRATGGAAGEKNMRECKMRVLLKKGGVGVH